MSEIDHCPIGDNKPDLVEYLTNNTRVKRYMHNLFNTYKSYTVSVINKLFT